MRFINKFNDEKFLEVKFVYGKVFCTQFVHGFEVVSGYVRLKFLRQLLDGYIFLPQSQNMYIPFLH